ncbi:MAG: elongation factor P [Chloroflexi bacterium]|nr:elongation factor P [Chloroflexota bacterium]MCY4247858.1 elongation factor P [Chloroflexota bacterium]
MIDVNQLRKGATFTQNSHLYRVLEYRHHKPGRGKATIRVTVRDLRSGATVEMTFNSGERVEDIRVEALRVEYLFADDDFVTFMNTETYEQPQLNRVIFGDDLKFIKDSMEIKLLSYAGEIIDYELPKTMEYVVVEVEAAVAGDTANSPTKKIKLESGFEVSAPMFINVGDVVKINLEDQAYVTRVSK